MKSYMEQVHDDVMSGVFYGDDLDSPIDPYRPTPPSECSGGFVVGFVMGAILL